MYYPIDPLLIGCSASTVSQDHRRYLPHLPRGAAAPLGSTARGATAPGLAAAPAPAQARPRSGLGVASMIAATFARLLGRLPEKLGTALVCHESRAMGLARSRKCSSGRCAFEIGAVLCAENGTRRRRRVVIMASCGGHARICRADGATSAGSSSLSGGMLHLTAVCRRCGLRVDALPPLESRVVRSSDEVP